MFKIDAEVITVNKFKVSGRFEGSGVANIKVNVTLTKVRGEGELQIHSTYEFESDSEAGGSLEFGARGMITVIDTERPEADDLYDVVFFHADRVFDFLIGNCRSAKANPPEKPDLNMLKGDILEMLQEGIESIYDRDELVEVD